MVELSFTQKLRLKLFGHVSVGYRIEEDWSEPIMHYAFKCPVHGIVVSYPSGYKQRLLCPLCLENRKA